MQVLSGTHHNVVPLLREERRREILGTRGNPHDIKLAAIAAFTIVQAEEPGSLAIEPVVAPPSGMSKPGFLEVCIGLNEPLVGKVSVGRQIFSGLVKSGTKVAAGVMQYVHVEKPEISYGSLCVARSFLQAAPPGVSAEFFATDVASAMFDTFARGQLTQY